MKGKESGLMIVFKAISNNGDVLYFYYDSDARKIDPNRDPIYLNRLTQAEIDSIKHTKDIQN